MSSRCSHNPNPSQAEPKPVNRVAQDYYRTHHVTHIMAYWRLCLECIFPDARSTPAWYLDPIANIASDPITHVLSPIDELYTCHLAKNPVCLQDKLEHIHEFLWTHAQKVIDEFGYREMADSELFEAVQEAVGAHAGSLMGAVQAMLGGDMVVDEGIVAMSATVEEEKQRTKKQQLKKQCMDPEHLSKKKSNRAGLMNAGDGQVKHKEVVRGLVQFQQGEMKGHVGAQQAQSQFMDGQQGQKCVQSQPSQTKVQDDRQQNEQIHSQHANAQPPTPARRGVRTKTTRRDPVTGKTEVVYESHPGSGPKIRATSRSQVATRTSEANEAKTVDSNEATVEDAAIGKATAGGSNMKGTVVQNTLVKIAAMEVGTVKNAAVDDTKAKTTVVKQFEARPGEDTLTALKRRIYEQDPCWEKWFGSGS